MDMPRKGITAYDLLISCPGDVAKYINVVKDCIDNFNRLLGTIRLIVKTVWKREGNNTILSNDAIKSKLKKGYKQKIVTEYWFSF